MYEGTNARMSDETQMTNEDRHSSFDIRASFVSACGGCLRPFVHCLTFLASASASLALTPAELVTPELDAQPVMVTAMDGDALSYFDDERRLRREPVERFVRLRFAQGPSPDGAADEAPLVALTDGQRFAGEWVGTEDDGQTLLWRHATLGELRLPLDAIRFIRLDPLEADPRAAGQDTLFLAGGERLHGFVASLGGEGVAVEHEGGRLVIPRERVRGVLLSNPPAEPPAIAGRHLVHLADGSRLLAAGPVITNDRLRLAAQASPARPAAEFPLGAVACIDFLGGGWRLLDLADVEMRVVSGGAVFGRSIPPRWSGGLLRLHAPVTVAFALPEGATRVAAEAELDSGDAPSHLRHWAAVALRLGSGGEAVRLTAASPVAALAATAGGETIELVLDEDAHGPILDRVTLRDAVVLVRREVVDTPPDSAAR